MAEILQTSFMDAPLAKLATGNVGQVSNQVGVVRVFRTKVSQQKEQEDLVEFDKQNLT